MSNVEDIVKKLDFGSKKDKIQALEALNNVSDRSVIEKIISKLDDPDIEVRGEAFSSLVMNENPITKVLIDSLDSGSKNIRGFCALVLANRHDKEGVSKIIELTKDPSSMVRSCALGALGFLRAQDASNVIHNCLKDSNLEVKKSAIKAAIDIGERLHPEEISNIAKEADEELSKLLVMVKK